MHFTRYFVFILSLTLSLSTAQRLLSQDPFRGGDPFGAEEEGEDVAVDPFGAPARRAPVTKPEKKEDSADEPIKTVRTPVDPELFRISTTDGMHIVCKLKVPRIRITTEFGTLEIPVTKIRKLTPGLESRSGQFAEIRHWIEELGGDDYARREEAQKKLIALGASVRSEIALHREDPNAERKRRVTEILKQLDEFTMEIEDEGDDSEIDQWIREDQIETTKFTVLGKVSPQEFDIMSKYGPLKLRLSDVKVIQGAASPVSEEIRRSLSLSGKYLAQLQFKGTGIRLQKGDRITVSAEGTINRSGSSSYVSSPDGSSRFGQYSQNPLITGGTLIARVGSGSDIKVGSKASFTSTRSGLLRFAIGMRHDYVGRYQFMGEYKIKVRVLRGQQ